MEDTEQEILPAQKQMVLLSQGVLVGNRIPHNYFLTKGKGESDITIHAGSYHLALKAAGIEMCNIITYSSILPGIATQIKKPAKLVHGSVMETIMAVANAEKGEMATAGIIYGWLYNKKSGNKYGGLVCEYHGSLKEEDAKKQLKASLRELYTNGYSDDYDMADMRVITESIVPNKQFGTAIVSLCFTDYLCPVLKGE